jgi:predicted RNA-binding protein associated with RNAse of E/G family
MEPQTIQEVKRNLDKPDQTFLCRLLHREMGYVVLDYTTDRPYAAGETIIPSGSRTIGHYWAGAGYILWEMFGSEGSLLGYYIHFCRGPIVEDTLVEYTDLILDLWVDPDGTETLLDEDDLRKALRSGVITHEECGMVQRRRAEVTTGWEEILAGRWKEEK